MEKELAARKGPARLERTPPLRHCAPDECHHRRHRGRPPRDRRRGVAHADAAGAPAVGAHRRRGLRQIREFAGHQFVQGPWRAGQARFAFRGRAQARRHRHVGRQPRPGARLSRRAAEDPGDHRDAGDDALREGGRDALARRRSRARRRDGGGGGKALRPDPGRARAHFGAPLRRRPHHRRARHHRARNAGGGCPISTCW